MGCQPIKEFPKEAMLIEKELKLGKGKFTIQQIKQAFFNLNSDEEISAQKIEKGLNYLGVNFTDAERNHTLIPFLKAFQVQSETLLEEDFLFREIMAMLFIMSKSPDKEKARALFRLYDTSKNDGLDRAEMEVMWNNVFESVMAYSQSLVPDGMNLSAKNLYISPIVDLRRKESVSEEAKKSKLLARKTIDFMIGQSESIELNEDQFMRKISQTKENWKENILTPSGIRSLVRKAYEDKLNLDKGAKDKGVLVSPMLNSTSN